MEMFEGYKIECTFHAIDKYVEIRKVSRFEAEDMLVKLFKRSIRDGYGSEEGQRAYVYNDLRFIVKVDRECIRIITVFKDNNRIKYDFLSVDLERIQRREKRMIDNLLYVKNLELADALEELGDVLRRHTRAKNPETVEGLEQEYKDKKRKFDKLNEDIDEAKKEYSRRVNVIKTLIWEE